MKFLLEDGRMGQWTRKNVVGRLAYTVGARARIKEKVINIVIIIVKIPYRIKFSAASQIFGNFVRLNFVLFENIYFHK